MSDIIITKGTYDGTPQRLVYSEEVEKEPCTV